MDTQHCSNNKEGIAAALLFEVIQESKKGPAPHLLLLQYQEHTHSCYGREVKRKPLLKKSHKKSHLQTLQTQKNVLWSDLFGVGTICYLWLKSQTVHDRESSTPRVKHGGGSIFILHQQKGKLVTVEGKMSSYLCWICQNFTCNITVKKKQKKKPCSTRIGLILLSKATYN